MSSKRVGNIGEVKALSKFVELGIPVYLPFGDNEKADMVVAIGGRLFKIQVKTTEKVRRGVMVFDLNSSTEHRKNGVRYVYTARDVDYFALYCVEADKLMLVARNELESKTSISIRLSPPKSNNQFKHKVYKDYTFEKVTGTSHVCSIQDIHSKNSVYQGTPKKVATTKNKNGVYRTRSPEDIERLKNEILSSGIDCTKWGWRSEVAEILGITPQKVNQWLKKNMLDFYESSCRKR